MLTPKTIKGADLKAGDVITNHPTVKGKLTVLKRHRGAGITFLTESGASIHSWIRLSGNYEVVE